MTDSALQRIMTAVFLVAVVSLRAHAQAPCPSPNDAKTSGSTLRKMEGEIGSAILRYRSDAKLPPLKLFRSSGMQKLCKFVPANYIQIGVHDVGFNPLTGVRSAFLFDSSCPVTADTQLKIIAEQERPQGKNGKLLIDDADRLAVDICPMSDPPRYRVVIGYWYSKLGAFLDTVPRGKE